LAVNAKPVSRPIPETRGCVLQYWLKKEALYFRLMRVPDFRQQMLKHSVKRLDAIVVTHEHIDHIGGMDDVRAFNYRSGEAIPVYAEERAGEAIRKVFSYVFAENRYPGVPRIRLMEISNGISFKIGNTEITPIRVFHHGLPVYGFRMGDFAYITDADRVPDSSLELLHGVKYLIINALRKEEHVSHFNLKEALEVSMSLGCEKTWLTHAGHQLGLWKDVNSELPEGVILAWDGLEIEV
jgi:phosphoribosyl 1,2-cyclic phosphate phosphodiesterase